MGLDMYLSKAKRINNAKASEIENINSWLEYCNDFTKGKARNSTPKVWNGCKMDALNFDLVNAYIPEFTIKYWAWDTEHKYPHKSLIDEVGYWRKANQIHHWIVENVQDGNDNCELYEVSKEKIEELLGICRKVKAGSILINGKIQNGSRLIDGKWQPIMEDGEYIENPEIAMELLPTSSGFFFGGCAYDQWYLEDIKYTIQILEEVLETTDFDHEIVMYSSSW